MSALKNRASPLMIDIAHDFYFFNENLCKLKKSDMIDLSFRFEFSLFCSTVKVVIMIYV